MSCMEDAVGGLEQSAYAHHFLDRHSESLRGNRRLNMPYRNLDRMDPADMREIRRRGQVLRERFDA